MLSKHDRKSRTRITAGVTGAAALTLAGLALTASGTQAAANLRADVGNAIGVDLQEPPAAPDAPESPAAVEAPEAPPATRAPNEVKKVKKIRIVTRDKDGKITVTENGGAPITHTTHKRIVIKDGKIVDGDVILADMPTVISASCGAPRDGDVKMESKDGKRRKITICTDRIDARVEAGMARAKIAEAMAGKAEIMALRHAEMGKRHAMMGLQMARRSIEAQADLSQAQRSAALKGIDDAIREVASADKD